MSILPANNHKGGRGGIGGIMSPYASEANRRRQYLMEAAIAGGVPQNDNSRFNPPNIMSRLGKLAGRTLDAGRGMQVNANRESYLDMVDQAGGLPAMASGRRMVDRFAAEDAAAAAARASAGPNVFSSALNRIAGNFVEDDGGLQVIPGLFNTGLDMQRGAQNAAGRAVMGGVRAVPGIGRGVYGAGRKASNFGLGILRSIGGGAF